MYNKATALKNITFVFIFFYFLFIKVVSKHTTKLQGQLATRKINYYNNNDSNDSNDSKGSKDNN